MPKLNNYRCIRKPLFKKLFFPPSERFQARINSAIWCPGTNVKATSKRPLWKIKRMRLLKSPSFVYTSGERERERERGRERERCDGWLNLKGLRKTVKRAICASEHNRSRVKIWPFHGLRKYPGLTIM
jgi:hypothetical protein